MLRSCTRLQDGFKEQPMAGGMGGTTPNRVCVVLGSRRPLPLAPAPTAAGSAEPEPELGAAAAAGCTHVFVQPCYEPKGDAEPLELQPFIVSHALVFRGPSTPSLLPRPNLPRFAALARVCLNCLQRPNIVLASPGACEVVYHCAVLQACCAPSSRTCSACPSARAWPTETPPQCACFLLQLVSYSYQAASSLRVPTPLKYHPLLLLLL